VGRRHGYAIKMAKKGGSLQHKNLLVLILSIITFREISFFMVNMRVRPPDKFKTQYIRLPARLPISSPYLPVRLPEFICLPTQTQPFARVIGLALLGHAQILSPAG